LPGYTRAVTTPQHDDTPIKALALVTSLKPSPAPSSSALIASHLFDELRRHGVECESVRCVDHSILPGVEADMGTGDEWPAIRDKVLAADILIISTPTWMGHMSSVAQRALERLDAELSYTDDDGRPHLAGKVAIAAVVGNEDGAHKIVADLFQALNDVGYTIPAQGCTYWNGAAMESTDYNDLDTVPDAVASATKAAARNAAHLVRLLRGAQYPPNE
jgi:multimeric flavodoxin WrbA